LQLLLLEVKLLLLHMLHLHLLLLQTLNVGEARRLVHMLRVRLFVCHHAWLRMRHPSRAA